MDGFLSLPTAHCHAPHPDRVPAIQLKNEIKTRAAMTDESSSSIINSVLRTYPLSAAGELPRSDGLSLTIRRHITTETVDQNKHWFADGTFKRSPDDYYQFFTLHAMMTNAVIPLVYGLLIGKSNDDYNQFFQKIFELDNFQPKSIRTDFESGTIKSVKGMLPNILHKGSLFHFSQAICRQVQNKGLATKYRQDECFRLKLKKLIALAFVPLDEVTTAFDLIADQFNDDADDLLEYFEKTWVGEPKKRGTG
ncbi:unnamed protein product [Rotaria magnacalcarata]